MPAPEASTCANQIKEVLSGQNTSSETETEVLSPVVSEIIPVDKTSAHVIYFLPAAVCVSEFVPPREFESLFWP